MRQRLSTHRIGRQARDLAKRRLGKEDPSGDQGRKEAREPMTADIPKAYQIVLTLAQRGGRYSADQLAELTEDASGRGGYEAAEAAFETALRRVQQSMDAGDNESLVAELISLRVCAMNIVADFDNLVDAISALFESDSV